MGKGIGSGFENPEWLVAGGSKPFGSKQAKVVATRKVGEINGNRIANPAGQGFYDPKIMAPHGVVRRQRRKMIFII